MTSNIITPNGEQCVEFFYYRWSNSSGELNLYTKTTSYQDETGFPVWTEPPATNGLGGWKVAQVSLGHYLVDKPYQIVFQEFIKANAINISSNYIFVDDVFIRDQSCLPPGDCDFENGFCKLLLFFLMNSAY